MQTDRPTNGSWHLGCCCICLFFIVECSQSYGENCRNPCSSHCYNQSCDKFNGRCLYCCTDGFYGEMCDKAPVMLNQNESSMNCWSVGLLVSLVINFVLISGACLLFRGIYTKKVSISRDLLSWSKKSIYYTNTDVKISEESTYQELDISENEITYQNTTIK
uniref:EGF-like domain-containing protein n=1 Tax=Magallana gigas TaxID=29159 RepID=A0A8W8NS56_MAGGI